MSDLESYVSDPRFSRTFDWPPDAAEGRPTTFTISYADFGYRNPEHPEEEHVLLFFGALMSSRLVHISKDELAKKHHVRFIDLDRPGMGGTDALTATNSMAVWRDAVLALLKSLNIQHVSMACHSGGTVYVLDMLVHHPELLYPDRPYLAMGAPWILPAHTNSLALSMAQALPTGLISHTDGVFRLVGNHLRPWLGASAGVSGNVVSLLMASAHSAQGTETTTNAALEKAGEWEDKVWHKILDHIYEEGVSGVSSDAALFLQKTPRQDGTTGWSDWGDYDVCLPRLVEKLREAAATTALANRKKLRVDVFYAESDLLIGAPDTKGPLWLDQCWTKQGNSDVIDYHRTVVPGSDHDHVWSMRWGAAQTMFERAGIPEPVSV